MSSNNMEIFDINKMTEKEEQLQTLIEEFGDLFDKMRENFVSHINQSESSALYGIYGERLIATYDANIPELSTFKNNFEMWVQFISVAMEHDLNLLEETENVYSTNSQSGSYTRTNNDVATVYENTEESEDKNGSPKTRYKSFGTTDDKNFNGLGVISDNTPEFGKDPIQRRELQHERFVGVNENGSIVAEESFTADGTKSFVEENSDKLENKENLFRKNEIVNDPLESKKTFHEFPDYKVPGSTSDYKTEVLISDDLGTEQIVSSEQELEQNVHDFADTSDIFNKFNQNRERHLEQVAEKTSNTFSGETLLFNPDEFTKQHFDDMREKIINNEIKPLEPIIGPIPFQPKQTPVIDLPSNLPNIQNVSFTNTNMFTREEPESINNSSEDYKDIIYRA